MLDRIHQLVSCALTVKLLLQEMMNRARQEGLRAKSKELRDLVQSLLYRYRPIAIVITIPVGSGFCSVLFSTIRLIWSS